MYVVEHDTHYVLDTKRDWTIKNGDIIAIVPDGWDVPEHLDDTFWFGVFQGVGTTLVNEKPQVCHIHSIAFQSLISVELDVCIGCVVLYY